MTDRAGDLRSSPLTRPGNLACPATQPTRRPHPARRRGGDYSQRPPSPAAWSLLGEVQFPAGAVLVGGQAEFLADLDSLRPVTP